MSIEDALSQLNSSQREAATAPNRHTLVLAGAGTGKTKTIIARAAYLISEGGSPNRIQICTFTRKAAAEIVSRVTGVLGELARGLRASTFHSWCAYLTKSYPEIFGFEGYTTIDRDDQLDIFRLARGKVKREEMLTAGELASVYSFARNTKTGLKSVLKAKHPEALPSFKQIVEIMNAYEAKKTQRKYLDYDDVLDVVAQVLSSSREAAEWIGSQYDTLMVDEMQDTNPLQWGILDPLKDHLTLFCVGDDAQSIYAFRGADFENVHSFKDRVPGCQILKLEENYRSTQEILDVANWLLEQSPLNYEKHLVSTRPSGQKPLLLTFESNFFQADWIAKEIYDRHEGGAEWSRHMVLVRSQFGGRMVEGAFLRYGIPYVYFGGIKLLETAHIRDLLSAVRIIANPQDEIAWLRYLQLFPNVGEKKSAKVVDRVMGREGWDSIMPELTCCPDLPAMAFEVLQKLRAPLLSVRKSLEIAFETLESVLERRYGKLNWDKRREDFPVLFDLADTSESILEFIEAYLLAPVFQTQVRSGFSSDFVTLSTVHSAKGLEADTVFVFDVSAGSYPRRRDLDSPPAVEEERRVLYVALTRPQNELIVTRLSSNFSEVELQKLPEYQRKVFETYFLQNVPSHLFETKTIVPKVQMVKGSPPKIQQEVKIGIKLE